MSDKISAKPAVTTAAPAEHGPSFSVGNPWSGPAMVGYEPLPETNGQLPTPLKMAGTNAKGKRSRLPLSTMAFRGKLVVSLREVLYHGT